MIVEVIRTGDRDMFGDRGNELPEKPDSACFPTKIQDTKGQPIETWALNIYSFSDVLELMNRTEQEIIVRKSDIDNKTPCLEIYDYFRE